MRSALILLVIVTAAVVVSPTHAEALGGEGETWPAFTESSGCGAQRIPTAHANDRGWFARDELLRGDAAAFFGRTVGDVHRNLVRWEVPESNEVLAVHPWIVPALDQAADNLTESLASDLGYRIDRATTYSAASRTIAGSVRTSRHTYGAAFDINARQNPNRADNRLITDLPTWWTQSFRDAGFCWGGLWIGSKDTMHFSWQGPAFSGYSELPLPYEPLTDQTPFRYVRSIPVEPPPPSGVIGTFLVDVDNNGARDVARVSIDGTDVVVDSSVASWRHSACSVRRSVATGLGPVADGSVALGFGDWDGLGGQDLWVLSDQSGQLRLTVRTAFGGFAREVTTVTDVPTPRDADWVSTGDADVDGDLDLFIVENNTVTIWSIDPFTGESDRLDRVPLPFPPHQDTTYALGDINLDNRPDLWAITEGTVQVALAADGYGTVSDTQRPVSMPPRLADASASDYDGDGRVDLVTFDGTRKQVWLGNSALPDGLPLEVWFEAEDLECDATASSAGLRSELRFTSSRWIANGVYEWRGLHGLPRGCDPDDESCVPGYVTHRDLAEFFAWVDGLAPIGDASRGAPMALVHDGYDVSCPLDDDACWDKAMLAGEVSAWFGRFLQDRSGVESPSHRWVFPVWRHTSHIALAR